MTSEAAVRHSDAHQAPGLPHGVRLWRAQTFSGMADMGHRRRTAFAFTEEPPTAPSRRPVRFCRCI